MLMIFVSTLAVLKLLVRAECRKHPLCTAACPLAKGVAARLPSFSMGKVWTAFDPVGFIGRAATRSKAPDDIHRYFRSGIAALLALRDLGSNWNAERLFPRSHELAQSR